jgi:glycerol-3-phosphate acyltransferase PlsY
MTPLAVVVGYVIGCVPTAGLIAGLRGIDLRREGSGNPGAKNALRTGGPVLASAVLVVEAAKGYIAVWAGFQLAGEAGALAAGLGAVAGNVYNIWYRFEGGKGLGISLGVLAAAWPTVLPVLVVVIVLAAAITRSAGLGALGAMVALMVSSLVWPEQNWPSMGYVETSRQLSALSVGMTLIMMWKHIRDSPLNPTWRFESRTQVSPGRR